MSTPVIPKNNFHLRGPLSRHGYDWWWHSFTGYHSDTGEPRTFFIEYFVINPNVSKDKIVFGQLNQDKPSYVMIKAGSWGHNPKQLHRFFPHSKVFISKQRLKLHSDDCYLSETKMTGSVNVSAQCAHEHPEHMSDAGSMTWDLQMNKKIAFDVGYGTSFLFRTMNAFEMYWHAQGMKTDYSGTVVYEDEEYEVFNDISYGYADKNWGSDFTSPWLWISSCCLFSEEKEHMLENSAFNVGGGRPKVFGIPLKRKLLFILNYEGCIYEFNFSKFWKKSKITFNCYEEDTYMIWEIEAQNSKFYIELTCVCYIDEMLCINYENPQGIKDFSKLWNGGTGHGTLALYSKKGRTRRLIDTMSFNHAGCEYGVADSNM